MHRLFAVGLAGVLLAAPTVGAQERPVEITSAAQNAIRKGLKFLRRTQRPDGSWGETNRVAKTAMACLAFMSTGSTLNRGQDTRLIRRGLEYILKQGRRRRGHLTDNTNNWADVHNHGYALLFLATLWGVDGAAARDDRIRDAIELAIRHSLRAQTKNGGWGYSITQPGHNGYVDEGSCSITQIQALRACRAAGFSVPKEKIDAAVAYVLNCQHPTGGFIYSLSNKTVGIAGDVTNPSFAITAAALSVLHSAGKYKGEKVQAGIRYLRTFVPDGSKVQCFYYYGHFYAAQVMMIAGGEAWEEYYPRVREQMLKHQAVDGAWRTSPCKTDPWEMTVEGYGTPHMTTAFALVVLQAPQRCLPFLTE